MSIRNPILPGFHPDPSWVRVDGVTYLTTSTFGWLPGLPVYRSRDLANWEALPPVLSRVGVVDMAGCGCDDGLYAPGIRHDGERFILSCTIVQRQAQRFRNFICTSHDPASAWSDPVYLPEDLGRIDPTPFVDEDGSLYLLLNDLPSTGDHHGADREIRMWQLDARTFQPVGGPFVLWHGAALAASTPEAPRLFKRFGWYYLLIAEGGTGDFHAVTMARSREIRGPYQSCPANPLLTHRHLGPDEAIRCVGHADLIQWDDGNGWACVLAERQPNRRQLIGRETWITPVRWPADKWPTFGDGRIGNVVDLPADRPPVAPDSGWIALRAQPSEIADSLTADQVSLPARPSAWEDATTAPSLLARRITKLSGSWSVEVKGEGGGIALYTTDGKWLRLRRCGEGVVCEDGAGTVHAQKEVHAREAIRLELHWNDLDTTAVVAGEALPVIPTRIWARPIFAGAVAAVFALGETGGTEAHVVWSGTRGVSGPSGRP